MTVQRHSSGGGRGGGRGGPWRAGPICLALSSAALLTASYALLAPARGRLSLEGRVQLRSARRALESRPPALLQAWGAACGALGACHLAPPTKAYLISLPGDEAKALFSLQQLAPLGLDVEVIEGIEGTQAGPEEEYLPCLPAGDAVDCQLGLTLAHRKVWRRIAADAAPAWVFEDDIVLHDDFLALFPGYWAQVPPDWEYVVAGQIPRHFWRGNATATAGKDRLPWGTHAYAVAPLLAERLARTVELWVARSRRPPEPGGGGRLGDGAAWHASAWQLDGEDIKIDHFLSVAYEALTPLPERRRWVVFDSTPAVPFRFGNVTWARHGGCECNCNHLEDCVAHGMAPAYGTGLVAQHICKQAVASVAAWRAQLQARVAAGAAAHCSDLRDCGQFVCPYEALYGAHAEEHEAQRLAVREAIGASTSE